jgi:hypothetical protein
MKLKDQISIDSTEVGAESTSIQTTLYDLIAAINEDVLPEEDWIIPYAIFELFAAGQAKFIAAY